MTTTHPTASTTTAPPSSGVRRLLLAGAVAAPLSYLAGNLLFPALPPGTAEAVPQMAQQQEVLLGGRLLTGVGALLFLCLLPVLAPLAPAGVRGARPLRVGLTAVALGTVANGTSQVVQGYATEAVLDAVREAGVSLRDGGAVVERVAVGLPGIPLGYWTVLLFALGWVVVGVALLRAGSVGPVLPSTLLVGVLLAAALASPGWPSLALVPFTVALVLLTRIASGRRAAGPGRALPAAAR